MNKKYFSIINIFVLCSFPIVLLSQQNESPDAILGIWEMIENGYSDTLEIFKKDNKYFGELKGSGDLFDEQGNPKRDKNNPDEDLRDRPLIGIVCLTELIYNGDNVWDEGKMYYPNNGNTYSCKIILQDNNTITARYYWGFSLLGYFEEWKSIK